MTINELIAECERLDKEAKRETRGPVKGDISNAFRSRSLLPLLVKVIKNQQRQIEAATEGLNRIESSGNLSAWSALTLMATIATELEDIK